MMSWQLQQEEGAAALKLDGPLLIQELTALHQALVEAWPESLPLRIDLSAVEEIDTAGLQWLVFLRRWARNRQQVVELTALSPEVIELVGLFHAEALLGISTLIPASSARGDASHA